MSTEALLSALERTDGKPFSRSHARMHLSLRMAELEKGIRAGTLTGPVVRGELARIKGVLFG